MQERVKLIDTALICLKKGRTKQFTIGEMRLINEGFEKRFLIRELSPIFDEAKKRFKLMSNPNLDEIAADAEKEAGSPVEGTDPEKIANVINLSRELYDTDRKIKALQAELKPFVDRFKVIAATELPDAMTQAGVGDVFPLSNGWSIERKSATHANLPSPGAIDKEKDSVRKTELEQRLNDAIAF